MLCCCRNKATRDWDKGEDICYRGGRLFARKNKKIPKGLYKNKKI